MILVFMKFHPRDEGRRFRIPEGPISKIRFMSFFRLPHFAFPQPINHSTNQPVNLINQSTSQLNPFAFNLYPFSDLTFGQLSYTFTTNDMEVK